MATDTKPEERETALPLATDHEAKNREATLPIEGMTCASCVRRVERALGKVAGVSEASVNLATEKARVVYDAGLADPDQLRAAVEKGGYKVGAPAAPAPPEQPRGA